MGGLSFRKALYNNTTHERIGIAIRGSNESSFHAENLLKGSCPVYQKRVVIKMKRTHYQL